MNWQSPFPHDSGLLQPMVNHCRKGVNGCCYMCSLQLVRTVICSHVVIGSKGSLAQVLQSLHQEWTQRTVFSDQEQIHYMCGLSLACRPAILDGFGQKIARTMDSSPIGRDGGYAWFSCWYPIPFLQRYQPLWTVRCGLFTNQPKATSPLFSWNQNRWGHSEFFLDHLEIGDD